MAGREVALLEWKLFATHIKVVGRVKSMKYKKLFSGRNVSPTVPLALTVSGASAAATHPPFKPGVDVTSNASNLKGEYTPM